MAKINKYALFFPVFAAVNLFLAIQLAQGYETFRLKNAPLAIEALRDKPVGVLVTDINKDGIDEIVFLETEMDAGIFELQVPASPGKNTPQAVYRGKISLPIRGAFLDARLDEKSQSITIRFLDPESGDLVLKERGPGNNTREIMALGKLSHKFATNDSGLFQSLMLDLEGDGRTEMIVALVCYYNRYPRGVACFEPGTGKLRWEYYCGPIINMMEAADLDGDGKKEIIISGGGINNGAVMNGSDDAHSYVIVLDSEGKERWKRITGEWYSHGRSTVADVDNDGISDIVTATECHRVHPGIKGKLFIFDGKTGQEKAFYPVENASLSRPFIKTFPADDTHREYRTQIYTGDSLGTLRIFNHRLELLKEIKTNTPSIILNPDTPSIQWDFLLVHTSRRLVGYDWNLERTVFAFTYESPDRFDFFQGPIPFIPFQTDEGQHALLNGDKPYHLRKAGVSSFRVGMNLLTSGLLPVALGMLFFNSLFFYSLRRLPKPHKPGPANAGKTSVKETARFLEMVQEIAQQLKNPISTIYWTTEKIKRETAAIKENTTRENYIRLATFLEEDVNLLKQQAHHLLKVIQIYKPCIRQIPLKPLLQHLVDHYRGLIGGSIAINLEMDEDIALPLDEELFKEALANLVDNAITAMPSGGCLTISAVPVTSPLKGGIKQVLIEIADTGQGIEPEDLPHVLEPFFTRKPTGTGMGLAICQRIVHAHKGTLEIHSRKDFGTRAVCTLPVAMSRQKQQAAIK